MSYVRDTALASLYKKRVGRIPLSGWVLKYIYLLYYYIYIEIHPKTSKNRNLKTRLLVNPLFATHLQTTTDGYGRGVPGHIEVLARPIGSNPLIPLAL